MLCRNLPRFLRQLRPGDLHQCRRLRDLEPIRLGEILDQLVTAGATDVGNIAFLVSDASKAADQAREAAMADARRKAEVFAHASGIELGRVEWITEDSGVVAPVQTRAQGASAAMAATVPISAGEDTLRVRVTVGFGIAR